MAKTVATRPQWDARAAPLHVLAQLYLIVRSDLEQWQAARSPAARSKPRRRVTDTSFFCPSPQDGRPEPRRRAADAAPFRPFPPDCLSVHELLIKGTYRDGKTFRPSDWAERLCGAVAVFFPGTIAPSGVRATVRPYHGYTSCVRPAIINGIYCVIIDTCLRDMEPRAWDYVTSFAQDNGLLTLSPADLVAAARLPETFPAAA